MPALLALILGIHTLAFGYFYVARGRRLYNLLFLLGFVLLVAYYGLGAWRDSGPLWLRYAGLGLVAAASLLFIVSRVRRVRAR